MIDFTRKNIGDETILFLQKTLNNSLIEYNELIDKFPDKDVLEEFIAFTNERLLEVYSESEYNNTLSLGASLSDFKKRKILSVSTKLIDFWAISKIFILTTPISNHVLIESLEYSKIPSIIKPFLKFLLTLKIFYQSKEDLERAILLCDIAEQQIPLIKELSYKFMCPFNVSLNIVFGGSLFKFFKLDSRDECLEELRKIEKVIGVTKKDVQKFTKLFTDNNVKIKYSILGEMQIFKVSSLPKEFNELALNHSKLELIPFQQIFAECNRFLTLTQLESDPPVEVPKNQTWPKLIEMVISNDVLPFILLESIILARFHCLSCGLWYVDSIQSIRAPFEFLKK